MGRRKIMNLEELKSNIDFTIERLRHVDAKDVPVLITLSENSVGARSSTKVKYVEMGFDFEHNQLRIEPEVNLVKMGNSLKDIKPVICEEFEGRKYYFCPRCGQKIAKDDYYCRYCGQKLR
jgi:hypothetical protein